MSSKQSRPNASEKKSVATEAEASEAAAAVVAAAFEASDSSVSSDEIFSRGTSNFE